MTTKTTIKITAAEDMGGSIIAEGHGPGSFKIQTGFHDHSSHWFEFYKDGTSKISENCDLDAVAKVFWQCIAQSRVDQNLQTFWVTFGGYAGADETSIRINFNNTIAFESYEPNGHTELLWAKIMEFSGLEPEYRKSIEVVNG